MKTFVLTGLIVPDTLMLSTKETGEYSDMSTKPLTSGLYAAAVREAALAVIGGGGDFTIRSLCEKSGLKPTKNLRRRLAELVYEGVLGYTFGYSERGHLVGFFHKPVIKDKATRSALPF